MPRFIVEQYETWVSKTAVDAPNITEAVKIVQDGGGDPVDDSSEYVQMDEHMGMDPEDAQELGIDVFEIMGDLIRIPSLRSVEEEGPSEDEEDDDEHE